MLGDALKHALSWLILQTKLDDVKSCYQLITAVTKFVIEERKVERFNFVVKKSNLIVLENLEIK